MDIKLSNNFTVKDLGVQEVDVYDIEVEENHNFFGNEILVHNSNYLTLEEVIEKMGLEFETDYEFGKWAIKFVDDIIQPVIDNALEDYAFGYGVPNIISFQREKIIKSMFIVAGKNYALKMLEDEDGKEYYDKPPTKITGIPVKKQTAQKIAKDHLTVVLDMILENRPKQEILDYVRPLRVEYDKQSMAELNITGMINDYDKYNYSIKELRRGGLRYRKRAMARHKGCANANYVAELEGFADIYQIGNNTMTKMAYILPNNKYGIDVLCWEDKLPKQFADMFEIDHNTMWEKGVTTLMDRWFGVLDYGEFRLLKDSMEDFFGFDD
jgi:hypothetical protein